MDDGRSEYRLGWSQSWMGGRDNEAATSVPDTAQITSSLQIMQVIGIRGL